MNNKKLKIMCDVDGVLANLMGFMVGNYNKKYGENVKYEDLTEYDVGEVFIKCNENPFVELKTEEDIAHLPAIKGMVEVIDRLHQEGHEVKFLTAIYPTNVEPRFRWLSELFQWFTYKHLIIASDKSDCHGDILIDDCFDNHNNNFSLGILVDQPWNRKNDLIGNIVRAITPKDVYDFCKMVESFSYSRHLNCNAACDRGKDIPCCYDCNEKLTCGMCCSLIFDREGYLCCDEKN